jgi:hypothetical protein
MGRPQLSRIGDRGPFHANNVVRGFGMVVPGNVLADGRRQDGHAQVRSVDNNLASTDSLIASRALPDDDNLDLSLKKRLVPHHDGFSSSGSLGDANELRRTARIWTGSSRFALT